MHSTADMESIIANMTLVDWLDDLTVRFLLNLPPAELSSVPRLCFQVEEAQWFYEDFIRPANPALPSLNLRQFCLTLFQHCPLLSGFNAAQHVAAYEEFLAYKVRVPVRGAILMDDSMEKVLLVRGWKKGASWSFPRGKINKNEPDLDCAIREVYEETGYDVAAAGLVDVNRQADDGQVKSIDITMREQHMKLFVFRGVPLDTYFEPRTRKEISKIQWYNVKDLPGFKKQKGLAGQGTGDAQTAKFYMVAPFLGHIKKFINMQRKQDAGQSHHGRNLSAHLQPGATGNESEADVEGYKSTTAYETSDRSADELKRLLSIGTAPALQPEQTSNGTTRNNLLDMLKGSGAPGAVSMDFDPRTPFDQIDSPFPSQTPQTPQPQHPRHQQDRVGQNHLGYSPQRLHQLQQPQRNTSLPTQGAQGPFGGYVPPQPNVPPHMQQHVFQEQPRQHSLPNFQSSQHQHQQNPGPRPTSQQQMSLLQAFHSPGRPTSSRPVSQGYPGMPPIGSGPSVPEASKLPPPKLNAHSMNLLDAFKSSKAQTSTPEEHKGQRAGSQQQSALLDLFRKPSNVQSPPQPPPPVETAGTPTLASPVLSDVTVTQRKSTTNEITRTLPPKAKIKPHEGQKQQQQQKGPRADDTGRKVQNGHAAASISSRNAKASPKQTPQFSILQRPSTAEKSPASPLKFETHPQVLKRPTSREGSEKSADLLNLSNKTETNNTSSGSASETKPQQAPRANSLLDLLNGRSTPPVIRTPEPPPAPQLLPERKPSQQQSGPQPGNTQKQQNLLNLFTKAGPHSKNMGSPGTPISPFTLGTPAASKHREASFSEHAAAEGSRSRIGSMASVRSSGMSSGQQTPTEAKDFMLGYLNNVVQKEGYRGAKGP